MAKEETLINQKIGEELTSSGFHELDSRRTLILDIANILTYTVLVILVAVKLGTSIFFYPRTMEYFLQHPISEVMYLFKIVVSWWWLYMIAAISIKGIGYIIAWKVGNKAKQILCQVYDKYNLEPPKYE